MRHLRVVVGTAISLAFLVWLFRNVDVVELVATLRGVQPAWLVVSLGAFALSMGVRVLRWRVILTGVLQISAWEAAELLIIGAAANNVLPARTGEVVRAALLRRRHGGSMVTALGTIVVERVFDVLVLVLMLSTALLFLPSSAVFAGGAITVSVLAGGVLLALVALALRPRLVRAVIDRVLSFAPERIGDRVRPLVARLLDGLTLLGPQTWALVALSSTGTWVLEAVSYLLVGQAFGFVLDPMVYLAICGAANLSVAVPSTSGGIGPYEAITSAALTTLAAVSSTPAKAYAIVLHLFILLPVTLVGVLLLWRRDLGLGDLARPEELEVSGGLSAEVSR